MTEATKPQLVIEVLVTAVLGLEDFTANVTATLTKDRLKLKDESGVLNMDVAVQAPPVYQLDEGMTELLPGSWIISFKDSKVAAVVEAPKPAETSTTMAATGTRIGCSVNPCFTKEC